LWLERQDGSAQVVTGSDLVDRMRDLQPAIRPRLVVLAACQSAGEGAATAGARQVYEASSNDQGALAALGPRLAEAGVPAVIAMQGDVLMSTVAAFMPVFFRELLKDGQLERAMAAARGAVRAQPDWWAPVLYTRLKDGLLYMPGEAVPAAGKLPSLNTLPDAGDLPTGSRMPYIRNAIFTGRRKELLALARHLLYAPPGTPRQVVITGMGGVGKSELAVEFCYRYGRFISGVHWIEATQNPMAEIAACGLAMGVSPWPRSLPEQASATLQAWNLTAQRGERHLVVLDSVE
jgi:transposase InsO family protein